MSPTYSVFHGNPIYPLRLYLTLMKYRTKSWIKNISFGIVTRLQLAFNVIFQCVLNVSHLILVVGEQGIQGT